MMQFKTHTGEIVTGDRLQKALNTVADFWADNARAIRKENRYASHVTEDRKEKNLKDQLERAEQIRGGDIGSFTIWQRVNTELTGECVALLGGK